MTDDDDDDDDEADKSPLSFKKADIARMSTYRDALSDVRSAHGLYPGGEHGFGPAKDRHATVSDLVGAIPLVPGEKAGVLADVLAGMLQQPRRREHVMQHTSPAAMLRFSSGGGTCGRSSARRGDAPSMVGEPALAADDQHDAWRRLVMRFLGVLGLVVLVACKGSSNAPDAAPCPATQELCGSVCADVRTDSLHCGACGNDCAAGEVCDGAGQCALSCQLGLVDCGGVCVNPETDRGHCGAGANCAVSPGDVCGAGEICDGTGTCALSCQTGLVECGGVCINPATDRFHCGAGPSCAASPGVACAEDNVCDGTGACELACQNGLVDCNGSCINPLTDRAYCGAFSTCAGTGAGTACADGFVCDGNGACALSCQAGLVDCNGTCIDPLTDRAFCGASDTCTGASDGTACADGYVCNGAGACELSCQAGLLACNGTCIDPLTDRAFCGASGTCTDASDGTACADGYVCNGAGACELSCQAGLLDCNGTCIDPLTDRAFCGASGTCTGASDGTACADGFVCNGAGVCELSCQVGRVACGGTCIDPLTDPTYCGAQGDCAGANDGTDCATTCAAGVCAAFSCGDPVTFTYAGVDVTYGSVLSNGACWLDRNLGATRVATASGDTMAHGDLFQWGRLVDGHQRRTSITITTIATSDAPGHGDFINALGNATHDWRNPQNASLWQGVSGTNNPCPPGWRLPTLAEWNTERATWSPGNTAGAFASPLKVPAGGYRNYDLIINVGSTGQYWTSTTDAGGGAGYLDLLSGGSAMATQDRGLGMSVRCVQD